MKHVAFALALGVSGVGGIGASAQSFQISQNGKGVGTASLQLNQAAGGFQATSSAKIAMPGLNYSFSENQTLDAGFHLKNVQLNGSVNGTTATVTGAPQGAQFQMKINANGKVTTTPLSFHPQAVFYPDFDPAALQILLNLGAAHNNRDIWAIVPKQAGSVSALRIATKPDEQGTLDGKAISVHHLTVTSDSDSVEVFSSPTNQLLQTEWSEEGFALVRKGFVIKPPARPTTPPPAAQQPAPDQQQQQPQQ
jgi:hypothetical protein